MSSNSNREVFPGKSFSELLEDIHNETNDRQKTIKDVIQDLRNLVKTTEHAAVLGPTLGRFMETLVQSDEHKIKIATIIQRIISAESYQGMGTKGFDGMLSDAERRALLDAAQEMAIEGKEIKQELKIIDREKTQVLASLPTTGSTE